MGTLAAPAHLGRAPLVRPRVAGPGPPAPVARLSAARAAPHLAASAGPEPLPAAALSLALHIHLPLPLAHHDVPVARVSVLVAL